MKILSNEEIGGMYKENLSSYITYCKRVVDEKDYSVPEASLCLPSDGGIVDEVKKLIKKKKTPELKYIVVVGIGGSNLGTKALYDALYGYADVYVPERYPKIFFLDSMDPRMNKAFLGFAEKYFTKQEEFIITVVAKSGTTTETVTNLEMLVDSLQEKYPLWRERCVAITNKNSPLWEAATTQKIDILEIPKQVGGRYSVFSPVGLFPLGVAGINIDAIIDGARSTLGQILTLENTNPALQTSSIQYDYWKKGRKIHNLFLFHPELESLGKWYRQLMGESIGKEGKGITPIVSLGSVDHHSMLQLYLGGGNDKTTEIIYSLQSEANRIPDKLTFPSLSALSGKNPSDLVSAIREGTIASYAKLQEPYFEVVFEHIDEREIGSFMQYKMVEMMYLAHLLGVNAFDQPQVELYKEETRRILAKK